MPRKKKTEVDVTCYDVEAELKARLKEKPVNYGSGMTKINNELMAKEEERNE